MFRSTRAEIAAQTCSSLTTASANAVAEASGPPGKHGSSHSKTTHFHNLRILAWPNVSINKKNHQTNRWAGLQWLLRHCLTSKLPSLPGPADVTKSLICAADRMQHARRLCTCRPLPAIRLQVQGCQSSRTSPGTRPFPPASSVAGCRGHGPQPETMMDGTLMTSLHLLTSPKTTSG